MIFGTHWAVWILYAVMLGWLAPVAARGHMISILLIAAWWVAEVVTINTGDKLPTYLYFFTDAVVACYLIHLYRQRLPMVILGLYPVCWAVYAMGLAPRMEWYALWLITLVQFVLAGIHARAGRVGDDVGAMVQGDASMDGRGHSGWRSDEVDLHAHSSNSDGSLARKLAAPSGTDWKAR